MRNYLRQYPHLLSPTSPCSLDPNSKVFGEQEASPGKSVKFRILPGRSHRLLPHSVTSRVCGTLCRTLSPNTFGRHLTRFAHSRRQQASGPSVILVRTSTPFHGNVDTSLSSAPIPVVLGSPSAGAEYLSTGVAATPLAAVVADRRTRSETPSSFVNLHASAFIGRRADPFSPFSFL